MSSFRSGWTARRVVWVAVFSLLLSSLGVAIATRGDDASAPVPTSAPREVSFNAALAAFTGNSALWLKVPGIPGEALAADHPNEIDLLSVQWSVTNTPGTATGGVGGNLTVTKAVDRSSPLLMKAAAAGTVLGTVVVSTEKNGNPPKTYETLTLTGAKARNFSESTATSGSAENVTFSYTSMKLTYYYQNPNTGATTPIAGCWNFSTHAGC